MNKKSILKFTCFVLLMTVLSLPLFAQAEEIIQESQYLHQIVMCKEVEEKEPVQETTTFFVGDEKAVCWIRFSYQSQVPFEMIWEWIDPAGKIYHTGRLEMEAGSYQHYRTWYWINIMDHSAAKLPGDWQVRVYVKDILMTVQNFTIQ